MGHIEDSIIGYRKCLDDAESLFRACRPCLDVGRALEVGQHLTVIRKNREVLDRADALEAQALDQMARHDAAAGRSLH